MQGTPIAALAIVVTLTSPALGGDQPVIHWSFQTPVRPAVPVPAELEHGDGVRNAIDAFVFAKLEEKRLTPAPLANRHTLVRRAYFDLLGLPPSPDQVKKFVEDSSDSAWLALIDELLESKHYGERWGRHWLDVTRYADTHGFESDISCPNAWRYRDYVVQSFNADKPYDQFVQEQIAGDEIWPDNLDLDPKQVWTLSDEKRRHLNARIATGLYTFGPEISESAMDARRQKYARLTDWVDTTSSAFLGLTMACARCHDHKFDPITQHEYFGLQAVFASSAPVKILVIHPMAYSEWLDSYPRITRAGEAVKSYKIFEQKIGGRELNEEEKARKQKLLANIGKLILELPVSSYTQQEELYDPLMGLPTATVLGHDRPELVKPVHRLERGELYSVKERIHPGLPHVLTEATGGDETLPETFGCRKKLALWMTRPDHPLTARVMVNRIWAWHFGHGIVSTPNDFGTRGQPPSHPELLDWLATEFVAQGWSVKALHRLILRSSTYQMSSRFVSHENSATDPTNRYLWRMNRRRLEAEALWDSVHTVAGTLNLKMGGRPVVPALADDEIAALREPWHWPVSADPAEHTRRGIYIMVRRNFRFPMFDVFDVPIASVSCPERNVTTVAPQALWGLNNRSVFRQAQEFAGRVVRKTGDDPDRFVDHAWKLALARAPTAREKSEALTLFHNFVNKAQAGAAVGPVAEPLENPPASLAALPGERAAALVKLCLGIYNLNEFLFID